jgi:lipopolysaccharide export system protein LptA
MGLVLAAVLLTTPLISIAQVPSPAPSNKVNAPVPKDTSSSVIHLINADFSVGITPKNDSLDLQKLIGHVQMEQSGTLFTCDSAIIDNLHNIMDAYGNIHINQDSLQVYGDFLHYLGNQRQAFIQGNTRLTDGLMVLTTPKLNYDLNARIGTYTDGGKLINGTTTLTSGIGYYFADLKESFFKKNVVLIDPQYTLHTDSLQYNNETRVATFVSPTLINTGNSDIYTRSGFYDMIHGMASFDHRPTVVDSSQTITSDSIFFNKATGVSIATGNVVWSDTAEKMMVLSDYSIYNDSLHTLMATRNPLFIYALPNDTLYMASDSLFSAPLATEDTLTGIAYFPQAKTVAATTGPPVTDSSSHRFFRAYFHVRIFSDSLQGKCDSLYYSFRDSTFRMYRNPILWTGDSQMTGDTIYLHTRNKKAGRIDMVRDAMVINQTGPNFYNQIKGNFIYGYFLDNRLDRMHSYGNAESIYYAKDDSGAYIGVNKASSSIIDIYFDTARSQVSRVVFRKQAEGTTYPLSQISPNDMQLPDFKWQEALRPKSKEELKQ